MIRLQVILLSAIYVCFYMLPGVKSFQVTSSSRQNSSSLVARMSTTTSNSASPSSSSSYLVIPKERDEHYNGNIAQYLVDLHDNQATFNFCGGMMFQLVLSNKLRNHLEEVSATTDEQEQKQNQPFVFDKSHTRMNQIPNYNKSSNVDNINTFHGREIRQVPNASGGMNFVLQLSYANADADHNDDSNDPEGWTKDEINRYDGWGHDSNREWRKGNQLIDEGYTNFKTTYGKDAFALHHRFYLHYDNAGRFWLSAEDGCEGFAGPTPSGGSPADGIVNRITSLMGL
jgi:hypothetical protein